MKCSCCDTQLSGWGLDTIGPINEPLCQSCFLNDVPGRTAIETNIAQLEKELNEIEGEIEDFGRQIANLENESIMVTRKITELKKKLSMSKVPA